MFEAVERHLSFTRAAQELRVTQGAASKAIATLEYHLGFALFERTGSGLVPCEGVEQFARKVRSSLQNIHEATRVLSAQRMRLRVLTLQAYSGFTSRWLLPRMPKLHAEHPDIDLRLTSAHDGHGKVPDGSEARIRYGRGHWRGVAADLLFRDELCPVCSPSLLAPHGAPYPPEVVKAMPLIHLRGFPGDWNEWLAVAGSRDVKGGRSIYVEELSVAYQAAESGAGVVLGQRKHLTRELNAGTLYEPCAAVLRRELGYYLTYRSELLKDTAFLAFRTWLLSQARETGERG
ncbi:LysR substrate-binding domain-containing protein [Phreatobacter sp.]|uniref:LysR substrate-binding domain-containing protein n=1 Tax=Phreatobacter sp. TaxID=1966341 RepID=UPI0025F8C833|nr:LysR substrate-binding domain-containing protein [Phreatobacter sp.]